MDGDEIPKAEGDNPNQQTEMGTGELAATSDALDAAADDLVDTAALARITGLDAVWRDQLRVTQAAESMLAQTAAQSRRAFEELGGAAAMAEALAVQHRRSKEIIEAIVGPTQAMMEEFQRTVREPAERLLTSVRTSLLPLAKVVDAFIATVRSNWPPNWPTGDGSLPLEDLSQFVKESRWPIIWVPEPAVVVALVQAPLVDRDAVLLAHQPTILSNCAQVLEDCSGTVVAELVPYAREAIEAAKDGHLRAAQSQAAAVMTTVLEVLMEYPSLAMAARDLTFDPDDLSFDRARIGYILSCIPQSLTNFGDRANGAPVPEYFNRHATLHRVCDRQYTPRNALVSLMLVSALLREVDELDRNGRWDSLLN